MPEQPRGRVLRLYIWSTWGDAYYVGLNGIEVYDGSGSLILLEDNAEQITANPSDINVLEGYGSDPRTVDNLMDGVNCTCDDLNVWLAPFTPGTCNEVTIDLGKETHLSMVRIWNYNKSRIHAARGARLVELYLDDACIFAGEIACAPGNLIDAESQAEILLFSQDERTLSALAQSLDEQRLETQAAAVLDDGEEEAALSLLSSIDSVLGARPATPGDDDAPTHPPTHTNTSDSSVRPRTRALSPPRGGGHWWKALLCCVAPRGDGSSMEEERAVSARVVEILLVDTWGDANYIGLTGLQVVGRGGVAVALTDAQLTATPRDLNEIPGNSGDPRTKDKLLNNANLTCDDRNMWLIPYTKGGVHKLLLHLGADAVDVVSVRLWNYNKSPDDAARGAKTVHIILDRVPVTPPSGVTLRKAPGHVGYDFGHTICVGGQGGAWCVPSTARERPEVLERLMGRCRQDSDPPALPRGLTLCVSLTGTHGDLYYVGLNAIEIYNEAGERISLASEQLVAVPSSINVLENVSEDCRTADKLIDGVNSTWDATHMWLAPYSRSMPNNIYVLFQEPVTLSMIKIWNYSRTPSRGASETHIWMDGLLVYAGYLRAAPSAPADVSGATCFGQSIMLYASGSSGATGATGALLEAERANVHSVREEQHCLLVNEKKIVEGQSIVQQEKLASASANAAGQPLQRLGAPHPALGGSAERPVTSIPHRP